MNTIILFLRKSNLTLQRVFTKKFFKTCAFYIETFLNSLSLCNSITNQNSFFYFYKKL